MTMTDILLVYPPYTYPKKSPPLGLAYIASVLERVGYSVKIVDMSPIGINYSDLAKIFDRIRPQIVGISFMTSQFCEALKASKVAKCANPAIPVIVGGPHVSALPEEVLSNDSIDFVVIGEGEDTMVELVSELLNDTREFGEIAGIAYKEGKTNRIVKTPSRKFIKDLDSIPFPAWHLLPVEKYSITGIGTDTSALGLNILSSRGCPNHCIFCDSHTVFGRCFRGRSAKNIFDEIIYLRDKYKISQFDFADDTMTISRERLYEFCALLLGEGPCIRWMCNARVNTVDLEMLDLMKKAGCARVDFGVESCVESVLRVIKKGITLEQVRSAHKLANQLGLKTTSFFMVGNIGEDLDSVKKSIEMASEFAENISVSVATPFPGTELYRIAKSNRWIRITDWSRYVTSPTYSPGYRPVMVTDKMGQDEILEAYFYAYSRMVKNKFRAKYGKRFFLNPHFFSDKIFSFGNLNELLHRIRMLWKLIRQMLK